jgi:hypothetical protein
VLERLRSVKSPRWDAAARRYPVPFVRNAPWAAVRFCGADFGPQARDECEAARGTHEHGAKRWEAGQARSVSQPRSAELFGEPDEESVGPADVAEPIRVFVLHHFAADELRAPLAEPSESLIDVVHSEHDT